MIKLIICPVCGSACGKEYPATYTDPAFREGKGEDFSMDDGTWCCSAFCLDEMLFSS